MNEADTYRECVVLDLVDAGCDTTPHSIAERPVFTDGRVYLVRGKPKRGKKKNAYYLLRYNRDFPIAIVEAKADYKQPSDGLAQAKDFQHNLNELASTHETTTAAMSAFLLSLLDRAFAGEKI